MKRALAVLAGLLCCSPAWADYTATQGAGTTFWAQTIATKQMPTFGIGDINGASIIYAPGSTTAGQSGFDILCRTLTAAPTDTTGQSNIPSCTTAGELRVNIGAAGTVTLAAGANIIGKVSPVDSGGTDASDTVNHAWRVNVVAGGGSGGGGGGLGFGSTFQPGGTFATLTATASSSASTALPAGTAVLFQNTSTVAVSCTLSTGVATAVVNQLVVPGNSSYTMIVGSNVNTACINQTGSASNVVALAGGSVVESSIAASLNGATPAGTNRIGFVTLQSDTTGGCTSNHTYMTGASTNSTNIKASAGTLCSIEVIQTSTAAGFLRIYDAAAAPTCSSGTGVIIVVPVQSNATSPGASLTLGSYGRAFTNGLGFCFTNAVGDADNTAWAGTTNNVILNVGWK